MLYCPLFNECPVERKTGIKFCATCTLRNETCLTGKFTLNKQKWKHHKF